MSFKSTRKSRRHRIPRPEIQEQEKPFFQPFAPAAPVQAKLTVGAPDDKYEREADAVANRVVSSGNQAESPNMQTKPDSRMEEDRAIQEKPDKAARPRVQRKMPGEEEEPIQQMGNEEEEPIQQMGDEEEEDPSRPNVARMERAPSTINWRIASGSARAGGKRWAAG